MSSNSKKKESLETSKHFDLDSNNARKVFHDSHYMPNISQSKLDDIEAKKQLRNKKQKTKRRNQRRLNYIRSKANKPIAITAGLSREEIKIQRQLFLMEAPMSNLSSNADNSLNQKTLSENHQKKPLQSRPRTFRKPFTVNEEFDLQGYSVQQYLSHWRSRAVVSQPATTGPNWVTSSVLQKQPIFMQDDIDSIRTCLRKFRVKGALPDTFIEMNHQQFSHDPKVNGKYSANNQMATNVRNSEINESEMDKNKLSTESAIPSLKQIPNNQKPLLKKRSYHESINSLHEPDKSNQFTIKSINKYIFGQNIVGYDLVNHVKFLNLIFKLN